jgi:hypothetical protein
MRWVKSGERGGYSTIPLRPIPFIEVASDVSVLVWWCAILLKGKWLIPIELVNVR